MGREARGSDWGRARRKRAFRYRRSVRLVASCLIIALVARGGSLELGRGAAGSGLADGPFKGPVQTAGEPEPQRSVVDRPPRPAAYPPPQPGVLPSATPDAAGYLAPPQGVPWRIQRWPDLGADGLLPALRGELKEGASRAMSARIARRFDLGLTPAGGLDSEAGIGLPPAAAEALLQAMFAAGAEPVLQGFFEFGSPDGPPCTVVLSHPWPAGVAHPPAPPQPPSPSPSPSQTAPSLHPPAPSPPPPAVPTQAAAHGARLPDEIEPDAAAFRFCADRLGEWIWLDWWHGRYEALLRDAGRSWEAPDATYRVLRP